MIQNKLLKSTIAAYPVFPVVYNLNGWVQTANISAE